MSPLEQRVTVQGRTRRLVHFEVPIKEPALHSGLVELKAADELSFDDRRYLAFETRLPERVLLVDGEPGPSVFGNETYYLETALRLGVPGKESEERPASAYEPVRIAGEGGSFTLPDLARYRIVFLCNVADVASDQAASLSRFVAAGGCLVIMVGDRVGSGAYRALEEQQLLPGRIGEQAEAGNFWLNEWIKDHPILAPFADPLHGDLRTLRFRKIARISKAPQARAIASAQGDLPFLVEREKGAGRCLLFAIPADNAWGDWAIHPLFLPLVHQVAGYLTGRLKGSGRVQEVRAGQGAGELPGVTIGNGRAIVRNVDPAESDVERTTIARLREFYRLQGTAEKTPNQNRPDSLATGSERPDEFWRAVAWVLLLVLVIETFVANKTPA
jgi:hypothetical protein